MQDENERAHGGIGIKLATINSVNYDFKTLFGTNTGAGVLEADGFLYFGGGGGNGRWLGPLNNGEGGNGGLGGGGKGGWGGGTSTPNNGRGYPGTTNRGAGGGSGSQFEAGSNGGSGIVIIRYSGAQGAGGGNYLSSGGNSIHTFTGDGTFRSNTLSFSIN